MRPGREIIGYDLDQPGMAVAFGTVSTLLWGIKDLWAIRWARDECVAESMAARRTVRWL